MKKQKLERLRKLFVVFCLIGWILLIINVETDWIDFLPERVRILVIPAIIAFSLLGTWITINKIQLIEAYEKGRDEEKIRQKYEQNKEGET